MCTTCGCGQPDNHDHHHDHHHDHDHHQPTRVTLEADILGENNRHAAFNRGYLAAKGAKAFNIVSSPGSGKTSLLEALLRELQGQKPLAVIEGDQQTTNDADRIKALGIDAIQINTANGCHLDAHMVGHAIQDLNLAEGTMLFIENVGNLVCPAAFDLGENKRIVVISVTEGDDKPLKYPYMFAGSQICVINKVDLLPYVDSDIERIKENARKVNPSLRFFEVSATKGTGIPELAAALISE
ncbi:MAG: hydrogenase nickel incorporation protein HypB [Bacteroidales bacterium]|nr:hydrogenase nickel incorporation protein HypB [Bacteroidales bacterium]